MPKKTSAYEINHCECSKLYPEVSLGSEFHGGIVYEISYGHAIYVEYANGKRRGYCDNDECSCEGSWEV